MNNKLPHHIATAIGFAFLILCYYLLQKFEFFDLVTQQFSPEYEGAGLMLGIGLGMIIPFAIWSRYTRWVEKKLQIKGTYYEDSYYKEKTKDQE